MKKCPELHLSLKLEEDQQSFFVNTKFFFFKRDLEIRKCLHNFSGEFQMFF